MKFAMIRGKYHKITPQGNEIAQARSETNMSSNGVTPYTTILWADGTASCDCPGWTRRVVEKDGIGSIRECRHSKDMRPTKHWIEKPWERPVERVRREAEVRDKYKALGGQKPSRPMFQSPIEELRSKTQPAPAPKPPKPTTPETRAKIQFDEEV